MTDAVITAMLVAGTNGITGLGTWYATRVSLQKIRSDEAQSLTTLLMTERREREEEIRKLRADIRKLQEERDADQERTHELEDLDQRIRHEGASLIRNCLTVLDEHGVARPDLNDRARTLEKLREMRREASESTRRTRAAS